ncbi:MAG TPA: AmmeMemoRadiSam system protein B [Candidatus Omnitrophota bacterium]|nr:AmmeMemoRadiSam system protein B [Candidatus Omnitrophota bacterium]
MKRKQLFLVFMMCAVPAFFGSFIYAQDIQEPNVAGAFYPDDPQALSDMIDGFFWAAHPRAMQGPIFALLVPHAGYGFSGQTAAYGYSLIQGKQYKTVVIIGLSHQFPLEGASVYPKGKFRTPLGDVEIDADFAAQLLGKEKTIYFEPRAFSGEHSVEVQIPFLQKSLSGFTIVPIVMGSCSFDVCKKLAGLLKDAIGDRKDVLIIASADLYHGYDYEEVEAFDAHTLSYVQNEDAEGLYAALLNGTAQICGQGGMSVVVTLLTAKDLGHTSVATLYRTNSAVVTGKKEKGLWTVGYASCAIDNPEGVTPMLTKEQRKKLLTLARSSIETYLKTGKKLTVTENDHFLNQKMGAFVTLTERGNLRGCIGNLIGNQELYLTIRDMAVEAATGDPRFSPVELDDLKNIEIEISVLSPMERVTSAEKIVLGKHGVVVKKGYTSGVFLPQVATETGWTKEEFLSQLCSQKAGLSPDAWKDPSTELYIFSAEVFHEKEK